jgi:glycosyltransferase involved in cell wall biosynthesis
VTVQVILDELARHTSIRAILVNTSPSPDHFSAKEDGLNQGKGQRMVSIIGQYVRNIKYSDAVLVFANNLFALTIVPLLLLLARWHHKPFYLKPVGGALDLYLVAQRKPFRNYLLNVLRAVDGVLAQTRQLQAALTQLGCSNTYYVPGCRPPPQVPLAQNRNLEELRLIFLTRIQRQKGSLILLEALRLLAQENSTKVTCDFYGPILEDREEFLHRLEATPGAHYCGVMQAGTTCDLIAAYDVLVLPTYYATEGHPGVIIEAMQAGVPVISTQHRAIPELITHGENGFLAPIRDSHTLAEMIKRIALDRSLRERMGKANYRRGEEFRADVVVPQMLDIIFSRKETDMPTLVEASKAINCVKPSVQTSTRSRKEGKLCSR